MMIQHWFRSRRKTKVELHVHMDGAIRVETFLDVARRRGIELPTRTPEGLRRYVQVPHDCRSLTRFLETFNFFLPIVSDPEAVERIAYEMCEDEARQGVRYFEARFSPHVLMTDTFRPAEVVERALAGLAKGQERFGVTARAILCCMRHRPDWSMETVDLALRYRDQGVAAIDLAGDETHFSGEPHAAAFRRARDAGMSATVHAGEAGPAANVREALDLLGAQRIGHGYHVVDDEDLYARVKRDRVPLECCLTSSLQTGAVPSMTVHPVRRFLKDGANFSLSTDDPGVSGIDLTHEYELAAVELGLTAGQARKITSDALEAAFLPESEKAVLRAEIEREHALDLVEAARAARERAYAPYSRFSVGAAVLTDAGLFTGVNVENASYPLAVCAERNAIATAVAAGARKVYEVAVIADTAHPVHPCGGCRQVIREFGLEARVHMANLRGVVKTMSLRELLPESFGPENLGVRP
jgi:adenosine deaminase